MWYDRISPTFQAFMKYWYNNHNVTTIIYSHLVESDSSFIVDFDMKYLLAAEEITSFIAKAGASGKFIDNSRLH